MRSQSDITLVLHYYLSPSSPITFSGFTESDTDRVLWQLSNFNPFRPTSNSESGVTEQFCPPAPESGTETRFIRVLVFVSKQSLYQSELTERELPVQKLSFLSLPCQEPKHILVSSYGVVLAHHQLMLYLFWGQDCSDCRLYFSFAPLRMASLRPFCCNSYVFVKDRNTVYLLVVNSQNTNP